MTILRAGIDLAKNAFAIHGVYGHGKPALVRPCVPRARPPSSDSNRCVRIPSTHSQRSTPMRRSQL